MLLIIQISEIAVELRITKGKAQTLHYQPALRAESSQAVGKAIRDEIGEALTRGRRYSHSWDK